MEQRDAQEEEGRSDRLWGVSGFPEYKRQEKREQVPWEMMTAEPLLLQGRNLSHLMICSKMLLETLSPQWD